MKLSKSQKKRLFSIISGTILFVAAYILKILGFSIISSVLFVISAGFAGYLCVIKAFRSIFAGTLFDENTLMTVAAAGAVIIGEYPECAAVMVLYQIGEFFQSVAVQKSRNAISELSKLCPDTAHRIDGESTVDVSIDDINIGDTIKICAGERIPVDCVILTGNTFVDTSPVTGESLPREAKEGDTLYSGCINQNGLITAKVLRKAVDSAAGRILSLTEFASDRKTKSEAFITKFAKVYTPLVTLLACVTALGVPLILFLYKGTPYGQSLLEWSRRALSMLVISCPCALVISVPLGYFCGLGNASKKGILIKGSTYIDTLAQADTAVFDKTGTLTEGKLSVTRIKPTAQFSSDEIMLFSASAEINSSHPIARAICEKADTVIPLQSVSEIPGCGVEAFLQDGRKISVLRPSVKTEETAVEVFSDDNSIGIIYLSDSVKESASKAIAEIKKSGIKTTAMLTGDNRDCANNVANQVGIDKVFAELMPKDKFDIIEELCKNGKVMYAGDGINDSPSLARADIGIAMGALGSDAALEAADAVLMSGDLSLLSYARALSKRTVRVVRENIYFSLTVKVAVLLLAACNLVGMWPAVLADVGVCIICVSNSIRLLK